MVWWLGLDAFTAMAQVQSQIRKLRPHKPCHTAKKIIIKCAIPWNWWFDCTKLLPVKWSESHAVVSNSLRLHGLYSSWNSPGQNTGVGSLSLPQRIFLTQESERGLLHCKQIVYQLSYQGSRFVNSFVNKLGYQGRGFLKYNSEKMIEVYFMLL